MKNEDIESLRAEIELLREQIKKLEREQHKPRRKFSVPIEIVNKHCTDIETHRGVLWYKFENVGKEGLSTLGRIIRSAVFTDDNGNSPTPDKLSDEQYSIYTKCFDEILTVLKDTKEKMPPAATGSKTADDRSAERT